MSKIVVENIKDQLNQKKAFEIRNLVFCKEQNVSKKIEFDGLDKFCNHFLAKIDNLPVGTARVREKDQGTFKIERMAVLKEYRINGVGRAIIKEILNKYIIKNKNINLVLNSQINAKGFYKKNGFSEVGKEFIEANIRHVKMFYKNEKY